MRRNKLRIRSWRIPLGGIPGAGRAAGLLSALLLPVLLGGAPPALGALLLGAVGFAAPLRADEPSPAPAAPVCPAPPRPAPPAWDPTKDVKIRLGPDGKPLEIAPLDPAGSVPTNVKPLPPATLDPASPPALEPELPPAVEPTDPTATPALPPEPLPPAVPTPAPEDAWLPGAVAPAAPPTGPLPEPHAGPGEPPSPGATVLPGIVVWPPEAPPLGSIAPILPRPRTRPEDWPGGVLPAAPPAPPAPAPPAPPVVEDDPWLPGAAPPAVAPPSPPPGVPEPPSPEPWTPRAPPPEALPPEEPPEAPPEGPPLETIPPPPELVFPDPPAGTGEPVFEPPPGAQPVPGSQPAAPAPTPAPAPILPGEDPDGFQFTPPDQKRAQAHADRLRATPTDASLKGYPADLVPRARAEIALDPASRPALVLFYDDGARASNLQAAELLPLLVRLRESIDVIPIDVAASSTLSAAEKKLVRTYYMAYVPTTVVLGANRKPILLQYQRVSAAVVEAAISAAPR